MSGCDRLRAAHLVLAAKRVQSGRMRTAIRAAAVAAALLGVQAVAAQQQMGPPAPLPKVIPDQRCREPDPNADPEEEIVVCGQNPDNSPYRIPRELRDTGVIEDRHVSWDTQIRDAESLERFSGQTIGAAGLNHHSRQVDCEWRAARQIAAGRRPDCGRGRRPGE